MSALGSIKRCDIPAASNKDFALSALVWKDTKTCFSYIIEKAKSFDLAFFLNNYSRSSFLEHHFLNLLLVYIF